jgi:glycosyltransferase involved in cell wall biosynthesis
MPIKVCQIITRLIVGGAQETVLHIGELLPKDQFQVSVISGPQTGSEGSLIEECQAKGIPLTILPELVREVNPGKDIKAIWRLYRFLREGKFDIAHTHSSKAGVLGRMAARLAGIPVIVHTVHGWSFHESMPAITKQAYVLLERLSALYTDQLIVVTQRDIDKGLNAGVSSPEKYKLIRSAIPLNIFDPAAYDKQTVRCELGIPSEALVLGNVGRFSPQKNPLTWIKVAGRVSRELPDCFFLLVGDGPLRDQVEMEIKAEGIFNRTLLTGLRRDVPQMMKAMDVFLLTSLWEGLPRVLPQAMSMGLPIVSSRVDGSAEVILDGENGYLYNANDIVGMSQTCISLLKDKSHREKIGEAGMKTAHLEFDVREMIIQIEMLYGGLSRD